MIMPRTIDGKAFYFDDSLNARLRALDNEIRSRWDDGRLNAEIQRKLYAETRLDEIYHSNRIEGNRLTRGETQRVIQNGETDLAKQSLDHFETRNLSAALDYAQTVAFDKTRVVTQHFLREFHAILMEGINDDAGQYRNTQNIIKGSSHSTPDAFLEVPQCMTDLSDYLSSVTTLNAHFMDSPIFCAAAAHALFVQIHPFSDGNGRTARALMNLILRRNGYPPCIIFEDSRDRYIDALEDTWEYGDLSLLVELMHENIHDRIDTADLRASLQTALDEVEADEERKSQAEYNLWLRKMNYLKVTFENEFDDLELERRSVRGRIHPFSEPSIKEFVLLRKGTRVSNTSFFRIELFRIAPNGSRRRTASYAFFFAPPLGSMRGRTPVVLAISKYSAEADTFVNLYKLNQGGAQVPDIFQIGFDSKTRKYYTSGKLGTRTGNPLDIVVHFLRQVIERDFTT